MLSVKQGANLTLGNYLFGAVKLTKNVGFDKYIKILNMALDLIRTEVFGGLMVVGCKYVIRFDADMSSSEHVDNRKKILILGKDTTSGLEDTALTTEKQYAINFSEQENIFF